MTRTGPFPVQPRFGIFTLLTPFAHHCPSNHHQGHFIDGVLHIQHKNNNQGFRSGRQGIVQNGFSNASKTIIIWASGMWVKYLLLHAQFSHHLGQLGTDMTFTHSIWDPSRIRPHDVDGSINPFHEGVHLVRCSLHESPSLCLNKGCMVIDANHSILSLK